MNRTCKELIPFDDFVPFKDYPLKKDLNNNEIDKLYKQVINDLNLPKKYIDNLKEKSSDEKLEFLKRQSYIDSNIPSPECFLQ